MDQDGFILSLMVLAIIILAPIVDRLRQKESETRRAKARQEYKKSRINQDY